MPSSHPSLKSLLALCALFLAASPLLVAQSTWNTSSGNWDDSGNWIGGTPTGATSAFMDNSGTAQLPAGVSGSYNALTVGISSGGGGTITLSGGFLTGAFTTLGRETETTGSAIVTGGTWNSGNLYVGFSGTGSLTIDGGIVASSNGIISGSVGGRGSATVTAGSWNLSGELYVGDTDTGSLTVDGGHVSSNSGYIAFSDNSNASVAVSSGTWSISQGLEVGYSGTGSLHITGGLVSVSGTTYAGGNSPSHGTITLGGGTLSTSRVVKDFGSATLNLNGGVLQARASRSDFVSGFAPDGVIIHNGGAVIDTQAFAVGITSVLSGSGTLNKRGSGTLTLDASNTYTGDTIIEDGTLAIDGSIVGDATVQDGATLTGSGTIGGAVTVQSGGTLSPGGITLEDNLTLNAGSTLLMEFSGTGVGMFDQIDVQGIFMAGGTLNLLLVDGYVPLAGNSFLLFNGPTPGYDAGSFTITTNLGDGLSWDTSVLASTGVVSVVPEPSTAALILLGAVASLARRRRF